MILLIIIVVVAIIAFLFWNKKTVKKRLPVERYEDKPHYNKVDTTLEQTLETEELFTDENGEEYKLVKMIREVPRRTYIKATLHGKYWGLMDEDISNQFLHSKFFEFNIYEVNLSNAIYDINTPFILEESAQIPREKLPKLLTTTLEENGKEYKLNLYEPKFANIVFNRKLHQSEGKEVFGTIDSTVSGYILDYVKEEYYEKVYSPKNQLEPEKKPVVKTPEINKTNIPTGKIEYSKGYKRREYFYSDYKNTYWDEWKYNRTTSTTNTTEDGCLTTVLQVISILVGLFFLLLILPQVAILLPFIAIIFLLNLFPSKLVDSTFKFIAIIILAAFLIGMFQIFSNPKRGSRPKPVLTDQPEESVREILPITDSSNSEPIADTLIKHYRIWNDYSGNQYEGTIWTKQKDYSNARLYKNNLVLRSNSIYNYDELIFKIKEQDKNHLNGIYQLFDSIQQIKSLSSIKFAELVVSFVQDIPYTVIVPDDCNPALYNDKFIKEYLMDPNARCDGFQKYGINTPVEFMSTLKGDCDTRTLLLYTILSHYNYDVALLSSEYYSHSLIGINLPLTGKKYPYQNKQYVLWETTAANIKAGVLPNEISNLNYWRISLKSK